MSLRERILRFLARSDIDGGTGGADPNEFVLFATVEPYEAPILREVLAQNGVECQSSESLTPGTWVDKVILQVARRDLDTAVDVVRVHRGRDHPGVR